MSEPDPGRAQAPEPLFADEANRRRQLWEALLATLLLLGVGWAARVSAYGMGGAIGQGIGVALVMGLRPSRQLHYPPRHRFLWMVGIGLFLFLIASRLPDRCPTPHD